MIRNFIAIILLFALSSLSWANAIEGQAAREIIVKWRDVPSRLDVDILPPEIAADVSGIHQALPVHNRTNVGLERVSIVEATSSEHVSEILDLLQNDPRVEYAEPRLVRHLDEYKSVGRSRGDPLDGVPNDPFYDQQWGLHIMDAEAAWNITRGDPSVAIAVLDLGVDFTHPELTHARWENAAEVNGINGADDDGNGFVDDLYGWDFVDGDGEPWPNPLSGAESHGTHVAGLAAAARNNGRGIAGLAPDCKIMSVRVGADGSIGYGYEGIYYACQAGAKVINCSWGGDGESAYERDVIQYAREHGCVVIASAGNTPISVPHYPAGTEGVMSVAATQIGDLAASFTQYGPWVKISAPGVAMISTICTDGGGHDYASWQGTSMSAPIVSATCALVASVYPDMDGPQIMARVMSSADPIDAINPSRAGYLGIGRVNAWRALQDSLPGLRLGKADFVETTGNGDGRIRAGESADISVSVYNDWVDANAVVGYVSTTATGITLRNPVLVYGDVHLGGPFSSTTAISVDLGESIRRGFVLPLSLNLVAGGGRVVGRGTTVVYLDSTFINIDNGYLRLGFSENGCLGYYDYVNNLYPGDGFHIADRFSALYHGSFLVAADGHVSDNGYGNGAKNQFDWQVLPDSIAHFLPTDRADMEGSAAFEDNHAEHPLFAEVSSACLAWEGENENQFLVLEYAVENRSVNAWDEAYVGFFLDWDLGASGGNTAGSDEQSGIAYVMSNVPGYPLVGIVPLDDAWGSLHVVDNRAEIDPDSMWNDGYKWQLLQQGIGTIPTDPKDISFLLAEGPLSMDAHESRTFAYALVAGANVTDLRAQADNARTHYSQRQIEPPLQTESNAGKAGLFPNPLQAGESIRLVLPSDQVANLRFFNILGQEVAAFHQVRGKPSGTILDGSSLYGASGILFYRIEAESGTLVGKLLIQK